MPHANKNPARARGGADVLLDRNASTLPRNRDAVKAFFARVNAAGLAALPALLARWCPGGRRQGAEYVALNPTRVDRRLGSFRVNLRTGRWADFATGDRGGDVVSLAAYLSGQRQGAAARALAQMLGVRP
jgi:hypothetical protein